MIKTRLLTVAALGLGLMALPTVGDAQSFQGGQPIMWGADNVSRTTTTLSMRGRAELTQGDSRIRADAIEAGLNGGTLNRVEASGSVYFVTPEQTIRGDRAVYTPNNDTIVLTGDVIMTQGENVITGSRLVYNTRTESAQMEGGSGGRVQGVFYPSQGN
ncbi:LptA/OstA family protein [Brevundimonas sp. GCM10030266]|uniref:LptA/OstA family protein n=1 Tax=Brevundimonas sp. GCM10030266 TaxID=3273386 RepID=UPI003613E9A4